MLHEVAAGSELEVVADRGGGGGDLAELLAVAVERAELLDVGRSERPRAERQLDLPSDDNYIAPSLAA